jgi:hypothetical protein
MATLAAPANAPAKDSFVPASSLQTQKDFFICDPLPLKPLTKRQKQLQRYNASSKGIACRARWKKGNREYFYNWNLKRRYKISLDEYDTMVRNQHGLCLICYAHYSTSGKSLTVDHNHKTGKVRGLLCGPCNRAIGIFKENKEILSRAADYLERHG